MNEVPIYNRADFKRLSATYWLVTHKNNAVDITDMQIWGTANTLENITARWNDLSQHEKDKSYIVKNIAWKTTVTEVQPPREEE